MSANSLIDLAKKLQLNDVKASDYFQAYVECITSPDSKTFKIPFDTELSDQVLDRIKDIDWLRQRGSDSKLEQIDNTIKTVANTGKIPKTKNEKSFAGILIRKYAQTISKKSKLSIINLINQRLALQVKRYMYAPRLVNRTGTFAESVRVVDIVETEKGYLSLIYTWAVRPYGVFSKYFGKSPWATPDRDPDDLSIAAISALVKKYYTERVYYRRLW